MPRLNPTFCQEALNLLYVMMDDRPFLYKEEDEVFENAAWRVRVHWFPANPDHPDLTMREPLVEVVVTDKKNKKKAFLYQNGTGCDNHPEFQKSGWRFHMV